jgi:REP element-mobilizing transposase RayT
MTTVTVSIHLGGIKMPYDLQRHRRRSIRLKGYDYRWPGAYFVTICTQGRACLFGEVTDGEMRLNDAGRMVERWWKELNHKFPHIRTDAFAVMPNHIHGIIVIEPVKPVPDTQLGAHAGAPRPGGSDDESGAHTGAPLPEIVQWFKTMTTNEYIRGVRQFCWPAFRCRLWQRNYYEHIIRGEESLNRLRRYIAENPLRWHLDRENPNRTGVDPEEEHWFSTGGRPG